MKLIHYTQSPAATLLTDAFFSLASNRLDPDLIEAPEWEEGQAEAWLLDIVQGKSLSTRWINGKIQPVLV